MPLFGLSLKDVEKMEAKCDVEGLVKALVYKKDADVRCAAAKALGNMADKLAVDGLIVVLKDPDSKVRYTAADALGKIGDARAVDGLVVVLEDPNMDVRVRAVEALGKIGDAKAVDGLIVALKDPHVNVCMGAAEALGKVGGEHAVDGLIVALKDPASNVRLRAEEALGKIFGKLTVEELVVALKHQDSSLRVLAAEALGKMGDKLAVDGLVVALKDPASNVRLRAEEALGKIGDARALDGLVVALKDPDWNVRKAAIWSLVKIGGEQTVDKLFATLKDPDSNVRSSAAEALVKIGGEQIVDKLVFVLKDQFGCESAVDGLVAALSDESSCVSDRAMEALVKIGGKHAVDKLIVALQCIWGFRVNWTARKALIKIGDARVIDGLFVALKDPNSNHREVVVEVLGEIGGEHTVDGLVFALKDPDSGVRRRASDALVKIGDACAEDGLVAALKDPNYTVRKEVVEVLRKIGGEHALDGLILALKDQDAFVRRQAAKALGSMKLYRTRVLPVLYNALSDADVIVRENVTVAIHEFVPADYSLTNISEEASNLISEALKIIETQVKFEVVGSGNVMDAAGKLEAAHKLHPENPLVHYTYASSLFLAKQYKSAREAMEDCAHSHPEFLLAQFAIKSWNNGEWKSLFQLLPCGPDTRIIPPVISELVKKTIMLPVRDGIRPRASLFFRDVQEIIDVEALQKATITLATAISPVPCAITDPQVVGVYAKICDNPSNPLVIESPQIPFGPYGNSARSTFEYFCLQEDMDVVIMDCQDRILLNKRIPFSSTMKETNMNILTSRYSSEGRNYSLVEVMNAIQRYQSQVSFSAVQF